MNTNPTLNSYSTRLKQEYGRTRPTSQRSMRNRSTPESLPFERPPRYIRYYNSERSCIVSAIGTLVYHILSRQAMLRTDSIGPIEQGWSHMLRPRQNQPHNSLQSTCYFYLRNQSNNSSLTSSQNHKFNRPAPAPRADRHRSNGSNSGSGSGSKVGREHKPLNRLASLLLRKSFKYFFTDSV